MEETAQLVLDLLTAWNAHDLSRITACYAPAYEGLDVAQAQPQSGLTGIHQAISDYLQAFPDLHFTTEETITQDNRVTLVWTAQGTHLGKFMHIPATGRVIAVRGVSILTIVKGKVQRSLCIWDVAGLLRAIGLLPEL